MNGPEDPRAWVAKADEDLLAIELMLAGTTVPWSTVCFHAQQVAEKMLKAYLVARGQVPPKIHDLPTLLLLCRKQGASLEDLDSDCEFLLGFGAAARYPGEFVTPTASEGREAVAAAKRVRQAVQALLQSKDGP